MSILARTFGFKPMAIIGACALVVGLGAGFAGGVKWQDGVVAAMEAKHTEAQLATTEAALAQAYKTGEITARLGLEAAERQVAIATNTREIVREVPARITGEDDARCIVNNGAVRLHDAAAAGIRTDAVPFAAGEPDGAASGIALSGLIGGAVVPNYGTCRQIRQQLIDLQNWINEQKAAAPSSNNP